MFPHSARVKDKEYQKGSAVLFVVFAVVVLATSGFVFLKNFSKNTQNIDTISSSINKLVEKSTPTPFPFEELTIPYLRARSYESSLGDLEKYEDHANYTSYLTSYDSDGFRVNGLLTIPKGPAPRSPEGEVGWPAIVFVHGYIPPTAYQTTKNYIHYVDYLAKNGLVVFKIDLRGNGNSEGEPGGSYYSSDYIIDTLNAYVALQSSDFVNPNRIGLWGHSMAGNVVFRSFVAKKDIPAVVIWSGAVYTYSDMQEYGINDNSYRPPSADSERRKERARLRETQGEFSPESIFWQQVVPTNYLEGVTGAVQIDHAKDDSVVNIGYSRNLMGILDKTQIAHELKEYPSGGHNIIGSSFTQAMQNTVSFFRDHLAN